MRIACRVPKATNTHSEYAILIALPQQQRAAISRYTRSLPMLFLNAKLRLGDERLHPSASTNGVVRSTANSPAV